MVIFCLISGAENAHSFQRSHGGEHAAFEDHDGVLDRGGGVPRFLRSLPPEAKLTKHVKRGDEYVKEEKFKEAVIEYRNAVKAVPKDPAAHWKLAKASIEAKDIRTGFAELQKTVELDPNNFGGAREAGRDLRDGREEGGGDADRRQPGEEPAGRSAGVHPPVRLAVRAGKVDEGIAKLKKAAGLDPKRIRTLLTIGNMYLLKKDRKGAQGVVRQGACRRSERRGRSRDTRELLLRLGRAGRGEKEYRKAIELSKEKETLRIALAEHYLYQGRMEDSEKGAERDHQGDELPEGAESPGRDQARDGKVADAKPIVDGILKENDKDLDGKYLKGRIALAEKRMDDAKALFGDVVKQDAGMARASLQRTDRDPAGAGRGGKERDRGGGEARPGECARAQLLLGRSPCAPGNPAAAGEGGARGAAAQPVERAGGDPPCRLVSGEEGVEEGRADLPGDDEAAKPKSPVGYLKMGLSRSLQGKPKDAADSSPRRSRRTRRT